MATTEEKATHCGNKRGNVRREAAAAAAKAPAGGGGVIVQDWAVSGDRRDEKPVAAALATLIRPVEAITEPHLNAKGDDLFFLVFLGLNVIVLFFWFLGFFGFWMVLGLDLCGE